jgi:hypothetical protein
LTVMQRPSSQVTRQTSMSCSNAKITSLFLDYQQSRVANPKTFRACDTLPTRSEGTRKEQLKSAIPDGIQAILRCQALRQLFTRKPALESQFMARAFSRNVEPSCCERRRQAVAGAKWNREPFFKKRPQAYYIAISRMTTGKHREGERERVHHRGGQSHTEGKIF